MTIGVASAVVGVAVLLAWIPLRNRPGIGTVANVIVIAVTVDAALAVLPTPSALPVRIAMMLGAVVLNAVSTVLYIGAGLGPGPARRADDRPGGAHRTLGAAGAHVDRGDGAGRRLAARRNRRCRHRSSTRSASVRWCSWSLRLTPTRMAGRQWLGVRGDRA